jgi:hypothetical protein
MFIRRNQALMQAERLAADAARLQAQRAMYVAQLQSAQSLSNAALSLTAGESEMGGPGVNTNLSLWAALSVNRPLFKSGQTKDLSIALALVNDGDKVIDPRIAESHIVINGKELADSGLLLGKEAQNLRTKALAPGDRLDFRLALGEHFRQAATYRVFWRGVDFQSPEIVIRIMPEKHD